MYDPNLGYDPTVWDPATHPLPPGYRTLGDGEILPAGTPYIVFNLKNYPNFINKPHSQFQSDPDHPGWLVVHTGYPLDIKIKTNPNKSGYTPFAILDNGMIRHEDD